MTISAPATLDLSDLALDTVEVTTTTAGLDELPATGAIQIAPTGSSGARSCGGCACGNGPIVTCMFC